MDNCGWFCKVYICSFFIHLLVCQIRNLEVYFDDYVCQGISSGTYHAVLEITYVEKYIILDR